MRPAYGPGAAAVRIDMGKAVRADLERRGYIRAVTPAGEGAAQLRSPGGRLGMDWGALRDSFERPLSPDSKGGHVWDEAAGGHVWKEDLDV